MATAATASHAGDERTEPDAVAPSPAATTLVALLHELAGLSTQAELRAIGATAADVVDERRTAAGAVRADARREALLVAQTARALHDLLEPDTTDARRAGASSWERRGRLARLTRWLRTRTADDPSAQAAADLCARVQARVDALVDGASASVD